MGDGKKERKVDEEERRKQVDEEEKENDGCRGKRCAVREQL